VQNAVFDNAAQPFETNVFRAAWNGPPHSRAKVPRRREPTSSKLSVRPPA